MTRYFYDTEFLEDGSTVELISIGIVDDDGREYYAVVREAPWDRIRRQEWLMANVVPHLPRPRWGAKPWEIVNLADPVVKPVRLIAEEVRRFLLAGDEPELWAYYAAYDHVALCQLWGRMVDLPAGIPMWTNDVQQEIHRAGYPPMPKQAGSAHDALADAWHTRAMFEAVRGVLDAG